MWHDEISADLEDWFVVEAMTLTLPLPPSMNHYWRHVGRKVLVSADGRKYRTDCALRAVMQRPVLLECEVSVRGTVYMARAGCDLDNRVKPILDALQGICYTNDSQVSEIHLTRSIDRANPRVEITIEPMETA